MPEINFQLPHWIYWATLIIFPMVAMGFVRRQGERVFEPRRSLFLAYMFWLLGGFLGLHRFYCKNWWGFVFIAIFSVAMVSQSHVVDERENVSRTRAAAVKVESSLERLQKRFDINPANVASSALENAKQAADKVKAEFSAAQGELHSWERNTRWVVGFLGLVLFIDAFLIPRMVRRSSEKIAALHAAAGEEHLGLVDETQVMGVDPRYGIFAPYTKWIDSLNRIIGEYVAYWVIISVFIFYYEVVARYVFNSPTNWVHESMYLMFGMQFALIGAYGFRDDSHVRVDILYSRLSTRGKALCDVLTSVFFFIFTITLLVTGWRFAMDAVQIGELSFTEWQIQYWPVKLMLPLGALLIILQGIVRLARDIGIVLGRIEVPAVAQGG